MAGDWIKMREDLHEDPAVLWMAQELGERPETVVGMCHRFWGLVSRQTCDGCLTGPTLLSLGNVIGLPEFPSLLVQAGWLVHDDTGQKPVTKIPHFERHLSESAKKRALNAERKRKERQDERQENSEGASRSQRDKSKTREEKSRYKGAATSSHPSLQEVREYFLERGTDVDPVAFYDHYEAVGWKRARGVPIKDWRKCLTTWERTKFGNGRQSMDIKDEEIPF